MRARQSTVAMARAAASLGLQVLVRLRAVRDSGGVRITEKWYLDHMGAMAFWRTVIGMANLSLTVLVVLKVYDFI